MKKYTLFILLLIVNMSLSAQNLFVGTYNIRYDNKDDYQDGNVWAKRCAVICDLMNFEQPDIFGTQEALIHQLHDLRAGLDGYDYIGVGRDDGKQAGEHSAIFYRKDRLSMMDSGNFWLNETPDKPVLGWDAACVRICTWGKFKDRQSKLKFFFFNLHMDHVGVVARREAAKLVVDKIKQIAGNAPVVLTGDFNVDQKDEIFQIFLQSGLLKDAYTSARQRLAEVGTFQDFNPTAYSDSRIDHIFVSNSFRVNHYGILTNGYWTEKADTPTHKEDAHPQQIDSQRYTLRLPSDHYPVLVKISFQQ